MPTFVCSGTNWEKITDMQTWGNIFEVQGSETDQGATYSQIGQKRGAEEIHIDMDIDDYDGVGKNSNQKKGKN